MKLKEVTHTENFCGKETVDKFNIHNNRFVLFDKYGNRINEFMLAKVLNYQEIEVLEVKRSSYTSYVYFVGFPTTHIKLDFFNKDLLYPITSQKFGEAEEVGGR